MGCPLTVLTQGCRIAKSAPRVPRRRQGEALLLSTSSMAKLSISAVPANMTGSTIVGVTAADLVDSSSAFLGEGINGTNHSI
jgi:hypothetical protein